MTADEVPPGAATMQSAAGPQCTTSAGVGAIALHPPVRFLLPAGSIPAIRQPLRSRYRCLGIGNLPLAVPMNEGLSACCRWTPQTGRSGFGQHL